MKYILKGKVFGRVQKVGFRAFTKDIADSLG
ncbi:MAG: acylphosphatase, partial [Hydrogenobaculum sp.]